MRKPPNIGVIGAGGFIGRRLIEQLRRSDRYGVRSIVRRPTHQDIDERIADALDEDALARALAGCTFVVHAVAGDRHTIVGTIEPAYRAAGRAGCRRLIYLSTAVVHGQAPAEGTTEASPLTHEQPVDYNLSKILAEEKLLALRDQGSVEVVILRPGVVYGPGSQWTEGLAEDIAASRAFLIDGGNGLCNAIHVDNLVHAILLACEADGIDREAFLLGEDGQISWREFYRRTAEAIGRRVEDIASVSFALKPPSVIERLANAKAMPRPIRKRLMRMAEAARDGQPSLEMAVLQRSQYLPSWSKAKERLGYQPLLCSDQAWRDTAAWLAVHRGGADA